MLLLLALACTPDGTDSGAVGPTFDYPLDDVLRISHAQVLGTHNSYHVEPEPLLALEWAYTHQPLDVQLSEQGVRQFELDARWNDDLGAFEVFHVPVIDQETTCLAFIDCLSTLKTWSDANPGHMPLTVLIEPKDEGQRTLWQERIEEFEAEVDSVWPAERRLSPDDLQGDHASLREAVVSDGWPTLGRLRGKAIFALLDHGEARDLYSAAGTSVAGRTMFVDMEDVEHPLAALMLLDDPIGEADAIDQAAALGMLVRTRADGYDQSSIGDTSRLQAALASGAHWLSTDYPAAVDGVDYVAELPGGAPARCNPVTAPPECSSEAIEDPAFVSLVIPGDM